MLVALVLDTSTQLRPVVYCAESGIWLYSAPLVYKVIETGGMQYVSKLLFALYMTSQDGFEFRPTAYYPSVAQILCFSAT